MDFSVAATDAIYAYEWAGVLYRYYNDAAAMEFDLPTGATVYICCPAKIHRRSNVDLGCQSVYLTLYWSYADVLAFGTITPAAFGPDLGPHLPPGRTLSGFEAVALFLESAAFAESGKFCEAACAALGAEISDGEDWSTLCS